MLDINLFRTERGGDPEIVRESQRRRFADVSLVDKVLDLDSKWREARGKADGARMEFNKLVQEIGKLRKAKQDATELQEKSKELKAAVKEFEELEKRLEAERDAALQPIGNIVHDSVPVHDDEAHNEVVKQYGKLREDAELFNHVDLVQLLGIAELDKGTEVAGNRGYYFMREGVLLNQAIINLALASGVAAGYEPVQTPFFMNRDAMAACAQLSQFDEELYKVSGDGEDKYLIATAEQPLCAMHRGLWFEKSELPKRYIGYSTCFRKEAGSHGRDTLGIFRVHQFEKVEQFVVAAPTAEVDAAKDGSDAAPQTVDSWQLMEEMLGNAESFYQKLDLPYHVVNIVSGELNNAAAKKYDLEAWFPASRTYRELVSCSNCTDYQSRNLETRLRTQKGAGGSAPEKSYVHMLNSTLSATTRTMCCILENYQTPEGVVVPQALRPYMGGISFIPFRYTLDKKGKLVKRSEPGKPPADA